MTAEKHTPYVPDAELDIGMNILKPILNAKHCLSMPHGGNHSGNAACVCACAYTRAFSQVSVPHCGVSKQGVDPMYPWRAYGCNHEE